jgi:DeoR family transcriptional regulator of aga operon
MEQQHRLNSILEKLTIEGRLSVEDITDAFGISPATVRRDLNTLAEKRLITRTRGGAVAMGNAYELPLHYKISRNADAKRAIAAAAASRLGLGDVVGLTGGTTTSEVARVVSASKRFEVERGQGITIVTTALNVANELAIRPHIQIVVTGGVARERSYELVGPLVAAALAEVSLDWAVVGVDGLDERFGATTPDQNEAEANHRLIANAKRVMVVADHSKFDRSRFARICSLEEISLLVTDRRPEGPLAQALESAGVEVLVARNDVENREQSDVED